ncbi:hypothetical protein ACNJX9_35470 [Bradyrhizobium sp. DASA03076]|uniref:hypothetical protein n=1 Tax=Bradyrhizobium sp. BLXBL-03 TaxID=3395916 RepID=UPI003F700BAA
MRRETQSIQNATPTLFLGTMPFAARGQRGDCDRYHPLQPRLPALRYHGRGSQRVHLAGIEREHRPIFERSASLPAFETSDTGCWRSKASFGIARSLQEHSCRTDGSAFSGLTIALDLLSQICTVIVSRIDIDPALMHRVAVIGSCTLDVLRTSGDKPAFNLWDGPQ